MLFTDIVFLLFMTVVFILYRLAFGKNLRLQNELLLAASYVFYGWWDWRFLGLITLTTVSTYVTARIASRSRRPSVATAANILLNIGILVVFKYLDFFGENLSRLFNLFGFALDWFTVDVLLPVGISFYTFQAISYSVDVCKGKIQPSGDLLTFATYIAYFPQLVAGPIERADHLLPQIEKPRHWDYGWAVEGMRMILFGLVKKLCVADMLAIYVDRIFESGINSAAAVIVAAIGFTLQIYCDFSAYSEMARGVSRLLGIELMVNFHFPLFARNIVDFWQRWHISLMHWLRDYIYIPLGGSRRGVGRAVLNTAVVFMISGLWHGAGWNYIIWGAYWALCYIAAKFIVGTKRDDSPIEFAQLPRIVVTFGIVAFSFYIFRCTRFSEIGIGFRYLWLFVAFFGAAAVLARLFVRYKAVRVLACAIAAVAAGYCALEFADRWYMLLKVWWLLPAVLVAAVEWQSRNASCPFEIMPAGKLRRMALYWVCLLFIVLSEPTDMAFIYFQF